MRSTLAAAANGLTEGADAGEWARTLWSDICGAGRCIEVFWLTDAMPLHDVLVKDVGRATDKRVRILVAGLPQAMQEEGVRAQWADTVMMLADASAKEGLNNSLNKDMTCIVKKQLHTIFLPVIRVPAIHCKKIPTRITRISC